MTSLRASFENGKETKDSMYFIDHVNNVSAPAQIIWNHNNLKVPNTSIG